MDELYPWNSDAANASTLPSGSTTGVGTRICRPPLGNATDKDAGTCWHCQKPTSGSVSPSIASKCTVPVSQGSLLDCEVEEVSAHGLALSSLSALSDLTASTTSLGPAISLASLSDAEGDSEERAALPDDHTSLKTHYEVEKERPDLSPLSSLSSLTTSTASLGPAISLASLSDFEAGNHGESSAQISTPNPRRPYDPGSALLTPRKRPNNIRYTAPSESTIVLSASNKRARERRERREHIAQSNAWGQRPSSTAATSSSRASPTAPLPPGFKVWIHRWRRDDGQCVCESNVRPEQLPPDDVRQLAFEGAEIVFI